MLARDGMLTGTLDDAPCTVAKHDGNLTIGVTSEGPGEYQLIAWSVAAPPQGQVAVDGIESLEESTRVVVKGGE
jgi:hypothetical protein